MKNLRAVLGRGLGLRAVVKTTIYLKSLGDFGAVNELYAAYFASEPPARRPWRSRSLPRDVLVEIE